MKFENNKEAEAFFDAHSDEYHKFDRIAQWFNRVPEIHAFILLSNLMPKLDNIVSAAEHDIIYLSPNCEELFKVAESYHLIDLIRCGVLYDSYNDSLYINK